MEELIKKNDNVTIETAEFRDKVLQAEEQLKKIPGAMLGDCFPLKHSFGEGLYVRDIRVPKDSLVITKIHKKDHPFFLLKGSASILTEKGFVKIDAPFYDMTKAGTKRIIYCHEDVLWVTVHATNETDLEKIEEEIIAKDFNEVLPEYIKNAIEI